MKFAVAIWVTDETMPVAELAPEVEQAGFESLWVTEHTHIPVERRTPWPGGGELPPEYPRSFDPFVSLAAAASVTSTLGLGTGVCLVPQHHPITLAKQVASIDQVSNGRFLFGVGAGWNVEEMENHGVEPRMRFRRMRESIEAMKELWTKEEASYHGTIVDFDPVWSWPKPVQKPHPPIVIGGVGPRVLERVVDYGDEWFPNVARGGTERIVELQRLAEAAGRGPIPASAFGAERDPAALAELEELGYHRAVFFLPTAGRDRVLPSLERLRELARL